MKRKEFMELVREAEKGPAISLDPDMDFLNACAPLEGIALHRERRMVSKVGALTFLRWQAMMLNGQWDFDELERLQKYFTRVDII